MAKTSSINRNEKRRKIVKSAEAKRKRLKAITQDKKISMEERFTAQVKLAAMPRNSAKTRRRFTRSPCPVLAPRTAPKPMPKH